MSGVVVAMYRLVVAVGKDGQVALRLVRFEMVLRTGMADCGRSLAARVRRFLAKSGAGALAAVRTAAVMLVGGSLLGDGAELVGRRMMVFI